MTRSSLRPTSPVDEPAPHGEMAAAPNRPIPAYFYPLLSPADAPDREMTAALRGLLRSSPAEKHRTLVYVHVPFCHSHCAFCSFYRHTVRDDERLFRTYVDRVLAELDCWLEAGVLAWSEIEAVYVGGGTPSVLPAPVAEHLVAGLRRALPLHPGAEISFEGEARTLRNSALVGTLREAGVTRISYGVQSFAPEVRQASALGATLEDVQACGETLRRFDYPIALDLMYGLPAQSLELFHDDLARATEEQGAALIDLYGVVLYPTAPLLRDAARVARARLPTSAAHFAMYEHALGYLAERGYAQLSFEDFSLPGGEYRMKDLTYGGQDGRAQTLALGACAVGYMAGHAYRNEVLEHYLERPVGELAMARLRRASVAERRRRALFFYPRRLGLDPNLLREPLAPEDQALLSEHVALGFAERAANGRLTLTKRGKVHADQLVHSLLGHEEARKLFRLVQ